MNSLFARSCFTIRLLLAAVVLILLPSFARATWTDDAERCYRETSDDKAVIQFCTRAIESGQLTDHELSITYSNRGNAFRRVGDLEHAAADYDEAVRRNPDNPHAYFVRGLFYRFRGEETKALAEFDRAIAIPVQPDNANTYVDRAEARMAKGDLAAALGDLDVANHINPKLREVYTNRADIYSRRRNYEQAIAEYNQAIALDSKDASLLSARGRALENIGDFQHALSDFAGAIALQPDVAAHYANRAWVHRIQGDSDLAIADYTQAIQLEPNHGVRYTNRANAYLAKGDWKTAMADYDHAVEVEPTRATYRGTRASAREYQGDYDGALVDYAEAIRLEPKNADWRVDRAWTLFYMGRTADALQDFQDAIAMDDRAANRYSSRANAYLLLGKYDQALVDYNKAIELQPERGINYSNRAYVPLYQRQPLTGIKDMDLAESKDPQYAASIGRGRLYLAGLQFDDAIREYTSYIALRPDASSGYYGRGLARLSKGELTPAAEDFRRALDFNVWDEETILWLHFCLARLHQNPREETARAARRFDLKKWPGPAFSFALGQISLEAMIAAAHDPSAIKTREQKAQAYFFAGQYYLAAQRPLDARRMFRLVLAQNVPYTWSDSAASAALAPTDKIVTQR